MGYQENAGGRITVTATPTPGTAPEPLRGDPVRVCAWHMFDARQPGCVYTPRGQNPSWARPVLAVPAGVPHRGTHKGPWCQAGVGRRAVADHRSGRSVPVDCDGRVGVPGVLAEWSRKHPAGAAPDARALWPCVRGTGLLSQMIELSRRPTQAARASVPGAL